MPRALASLSGDDAAVVVREDDDRSSFDGRIEDPFAGRVEVVAVDEGVEAHGA